MRKVLFVLTLLGLAAQGTNATEHTANPIRKVVNMLQLMVTKIDKEGEKQEDLYNKFQCYCKTGGETLAGSIAAAEAKAPELASAIDESTSQKAQIEEDLSSHQSDRAAAKEAMAKATTIRKKEAAAFATLDAEQKADIAAMGKAVSALESGMAGSFIQTQAARSLQQVITNQRDISDLDRRDIMAFLQGGSTDGYSPKSGQIVGLLKQLKERTEKDLADATADEQDAIKNYEGLMAAKTKEVGALTSSIEAKTQRGGELAVEIVQLTNDHEDTIGNLADDKAFLADLDKNCKAKAAQWAEMQKTRAEELVALQETIKVLNDDDALDLFKNTLPGAAGFMQIKVSSEQMRKKALDIITKAPTGTKLDFIALALRGKKIGFEKVIAMIDEMMQTLKEEQVADDKKQEYCAAEFDSTEDKKKALERKISDLEAAIEDSKTAIDTLKGESVDLTAAIKALDKQVAEATEQRKEENADYKDLMKNNGMAKELLKFAKNRLNKFYNPKLYKPPPAAQLSDEDQIVSNLGGDLGPTAAPGGIAGTGIGAFVQIRAHKRLNELEAPAPPPATFDGYSKKSGESNGVIAMIDLLVKDLDKEMTEAETDEKDSQGDYEKMMSDSQAKRADDAKSLQNKQSAIASTEEQLSSHKQDLTENTRNNMANDEAISALHGECDWLVKYHAARKEARNGEIDAMNNAKSVLSGADYSFAQRRAVRSLRGSN